MKNTESFNYVLNKKVGDTYHVECEVESEKELYRMIAGIIGSHVLEEDPFMKDTDDGVMTGTDEALKHHEAIEKALKEIKEYTYKFMINELFGMIAKIGGSEDDGDDLL